MDHAEHTSHDGHTSDAHDGHGGLAKYFYIFFALCVLSTASFFTTTDTWHQWFHDRPEVGWFFMMAVSSAKAMCVLMVFMHLKWEADWKYVLTVPASIMSLFLVLALVPDIGLRVRKYSQERLEHVATRAEDQSLRAVSAEMAAERGEHGAPHDGHGAAEDHGHAPANAAPAAAAHEAAH